MPRKRKIDRSPKKTRNYYVVDTCFLANKFIPLKFVPDDQRGRVNRCKKWWEEIDNQVNNRRARVYVPDICIAETFKVLASKRFDKDQKWFKSPHDYNNARRRLSKQITITHQILKAKEREIPYHDLATTRDIIISVDRFYQQFIKNGHHVSLPDLMVTAGAKYLMDFFDIPKKNLFIITLDEALWKGIKKISELPNAFNPSEEADYAEKIFRSS